SGSDRIDGKVAQAHRVARVRGQAVTRYRENGKSQTIDSADGGSRWERGRELRQTRLHDLQGLEYVGPPVEEAVDFRRTACRGRADAHDSGNTIHGFLDRARNRDEHLRGRHYAVVHYDDDPGKVGLREKRARQLPGGIETHRTQQHNQYDNGT